MKQLKTLNTVGDNTHCNIDGIGEPWDMFVTYDHNKHSRSVELYRGSDSFIFYQKSQLKNAIDAMQTFLDTWNIDYPDDE